MLKRKRFYWFIVPLMVLGLLFPVSPAGSQAGGTAVDRVSGARNLIDVVLEASTAPAPGGVATLTLSATPLIAAPDLYIRWAVPAGVELLGLETESLGAVSANQTVQSQRQVRFPSSGIYKVAAEAAFSPGAGIHLGASGVLFFTVRAFNPRVSELDPQAHSPMHSKMPAQMTLSDIQPNRPITPTRDPCFTVMGSINRMDKPSTPTGFGAIVTVPLRNAVVEVRESDIFFDDSYGEVVTDAGGNFSFAFCDDDGWFDDELEIYVRLRAELRDSGHTAVEVSDIIGIDEVYEFDSDWFISSGGTLNFSIDLTEDQSEVFNIADAILDAFQLWNDSGGASTGDRIFSEPADARWDPHEDESITHYDSDWGEITIADDPSDPDMWDDSVIIHEWGHLATDEYSCNESPGGPHSANTLIVPQMAWSEGFADYYQSAARADRGDPFGNFFINLNGMGTLGFSINIETWDVDKPALVSARNEIAVAATLWDFIDLSIDGQDTVSHGHPMIQAVFTSEEVAEDDESCGFFTYMRSWVQAGNPADAQTAAVLMQNSGFTLPPAMLTVQAAESMVSTDLVDPSSIYRWWNQLTYVGDNSASMTGPKYEALKTLFAEAVNDLGSDPKGTEFGLEQFNNTSSTNQVAFAGQFFPETLIEPINRLSPSGATDADCRVYALDALAQAADDKTNADLWLFTDGDTHQSPSVEVVRQILNERQLRTSVALMGICPVVEEAPDTLAPITTAILEGLTVEQQQEMMAERLIQGQARASLGPLADDVPGGLVPYLLTALNSGGQFLYVDSSQVTDAANILRAQITNSAGAGRWSDYVSDTPTYRFDTLASYEYNWIDAAAYGTNQGNPEAKLYLDIKLPRPFPYFSAGSYDSLNVFQDGYVTFGDHFGYDDDNTTLPNPSEPNNALYPFWDDLEPYYIFCEVTSPQDCGTAGWIYTLEQGDWFVVEYFQYGSVDTGFPLNTFEILLNMVTGEIRYQYHTVPDGASSATIGLENGSGTRAVQASYNDASAVYDGMGYKFTPAPPQPSKTYTVMVDSTVQSVAFLLTGYSGSFEPLAITDPDGNLISCGDTSVLCLDLGLVQYVQVNTGGLTGDWHATVDAGSTGSGTFSFTSFAASPIAVESGYDHTLSTDEASLLVDLSQAVDGNMLTGLFLEMDGEAFGGEFPLYDDGAHGDGQPGDGLFGSGPFTPPRAGSAYLWLEGLSVGEAFLRSDPVPYTFTPLEVTSLGDGDNFGDATQLTFKFDNHDSVIHCYWIDYDAPDGWWINTDILPLLCISAGASQSIDFDVYMTAGSSNDLPSGTTGIVTLSATEWEKGEISNTASARITRYRNPVTIQIHNPTDYLRPGGDKTTLEFLVLDEQGVPVSDITSVNLIASSGTISPTTVLTRGGYFQAEFTSGPDIGNAIVTAITMNDISASSEIEIANPKPDQINLSVSTHSLPTDGTSTADLVATVTDRWGTPMPGQMVRIGLEGDGQLGAINGGEVVTGTTDANGQFTAILTSGTLFGRGAVRAELLYDQGAGLEVVREAREMILFGTKIFLPRIEQ